ncbi:MAG: response regulator [Solirubrobacteraceae bacterium]
MAATLSSAIEAIWETSREEIGRRIATLEHAVAAMLAGDLGDDLRARAHSDAHKLAGSLGMFGFATGSALAQQLEQALATDGAPELGDVPHLAELTVALRHELEGGREAVPVTNVPPPRDGSLVLLVVDDDDQRGQALLGAAEARGVRMLLATDLHRARGLIAQASPELVLLSMSIGGDVDAAMGFLAETSTTRPVMVLGGVHSQLDRVEVATCGGRGFLAPSLDPSEMIAAAIDLHERLRVRGTRILAVDDDEVVLSVLSSVLGEAGLSVATCGRPTDFWKRLDEFAPDLVLLDFDMPGVSGPQLCRAMRNEPRWAGIPVIFLTSRTDVESVRTVFDAGADDYLSKPFVGPEVVARIASRLERVRLYRALADHDSLTGLPNRRKSVEVLDTLMRMADRRQQPMSFAIVDVDRFKSINDAYGHAGGDAVLCELGSLMTRYFRGEDVVARWGGDELVVGMYAMTDADARQRLGALVEQVRDHRFHDAGIAVTLSIGVAQYGTDGADIAELYHAADAALYIAKAEGRDRVVAAGRGPADGPATVDVAIVEDDAVLGRLLEHALQTRGYRTHLITDGVTAATELAAADPKILAPLLLLDWDLPGLDGLRVLRALRDGGVLERTQVIMLTARGAESEVLAALEAGAIDHITKPFSVPALMQRVRRAVERCTAGFSDPRSMPIA